MTPYIGTYKGLSYSPEGYSNLHFVRIAMSTISRCNLHLTLIPKRYGSHNTSDIIWRHTHMVIFISPLYYYSLVILYIYYIDENLDFMSKIKLVPISTLGHADHDGTSPMSLSLILMEIFDFEVTKGPPYIYTIRVEISS